MNFKTGGGQQVGYRCTICGATAVADVERSGGIGGDEFNLDLSGVQVAVFGFQTSKDPRETQRLKNRWLEKFIKYGASKVVFLPAEENFSIDAFRGI